MEWKDTFTICIGAKMIDTLNAMFGDTLWIYTAIAGSIVGAGFLAWFRNTKMALWAMSKFDNFMDMLVDKLGWEFLQDDPEAWRKRYPKVTKKIDDLELRIRVLESNQGNKIIKQKKVKK
jgi:hypothetical protein